MKKHTLFSFVLVFTLLFTLFSFGVNTASADNCAPTDRYDSNTGNLCSVTSATTTGGRGTLPLGCNDPRPIQMFSTAIANTPCLYINTSLGQSSFTVISPTITVSKAIVSSGDSSLISWTIPRDVVSAKLFVSCPSGISGKNVDGISSNSFEECNRWTNVSVNYAGSKEIAFTNNTSSSINVVPNLYIYRASNPTYAVAVSTQVTVNPATIQVSNATVSASLYYAGEDKVGAWKNFGPGTGNINKNPNDWYWGATINLPTRKTVSRITIIHNIRGEVWSTGYSRYLGAGNNPSDLYGYEEHPYPIVVTRDGNQVNYTYDRNILTGTGSYFLKLYGQPESTSFSGGKIVVEFSDGTYASSEISASNITQQPVVSAQASLSAYLVDASSDQAGAWDNFGPGVGHSNKTTYDWHWNASLNLPVANKIKSISLSHSNGYEAWSTSAQNIYGKKPYPLVVFAETSQLNYNFTYSEELVGKLGKFSFRSYEFPARNYTLDLYGQIETERFSGGNLVVTFTDGTTVSTDIPASSIRLPYPVQSSISVKSPNGGEIIRTTEGFNVEWRYVGTDNNKFVYTFLKLPNNSYCFIASSPVSRGRATYNIPINYSCPNISATISSSSNYKIAIAVDSPNMSIYQVADNLISGSAIGDESDNYFTVTTPVVPSLPPTISSLTGPTTIVAGTQGSWSLSANKADDDLVAYDIDWGDGTRKVVEHVSGGSFSVTKNHTYATAGTYTIRATVADYRADEASKTMTVVVTPVIIPTVYPARVSLISPSHAKIGESVTIYGGDFNIVNSNNVYIKNIATNVTTTLSLRSRSNSGTALVFDVPTDLAVGEYSVIVNNDLSATSSNAVAFWVDQTSLGVNSASLSGSTLTLNYSKNIGNTCAHIIPAEAWSPVYGSVCSEGSNVTSSISVSDLLVGASIRICHGNNYGICSGGVRVTN